MRSTMQQMLSSVALAVCLLAFLAASALASPGELDPTFTTGAGFNGTVTAIAVQPDGKIVVGGGFTLYASTATAYIARLNADGTLDRSFVGVTGLDSAIYAVALQPDGKIIIGGAFTCIGATDPSTALQCLSTGGATRNRIARLNSDGTLDTGYALPAMSGFDGPVRTLALQADGKVIVGGDFTTGYGTPVAVHSIARLDTDGRVDPTFVQTGVGLDGPVFTTAIQPDGKVLIGGNFTHLEGSSMPYVARLNSNGAMDTTFVPTGTGLDGLVLSLALQSDGNVVAGGSFTSYNAVARSRLARLTSTGGLDTTFAPTTGLVGGSGAYVALQPNGKIVVAGGFTEYNGTARAGLAQVLSDGSLDSTFAVGTGLNATAQVVTVAAGSVLVGGNFTTYNGATRGSLARIYGTASLALSKSGAGTGTVTSAAAGIACGTTCSAVFDQASSVTLTATAAAGSTFTGWGGACSGTSATCVVTMSAAVAVTATFAPDSAFTVTKVKAKTSAGRIVLTSTITVPGAGAIAQIATTKKGKTTTTRCSTKKVASKAGTYKLTCTIRNSASAALRKASLALTIRTAFTPTNGSLAAKTQALKVKRLR